MIIVTLSAVCTLGKGHVEMVNTNAIVYCVCYVCLSTVLTYTVKTIRMAPYVIQCSMQHESTMLTYPGSCKTCFSAYQFLMGKVSSIFPIIDLIGDLKLICINDLSDLLNTLISADSCPR